MSAFIGTELDLMLRTLGVTNLVVCGIQTPNCIRTTVFDGIAYNYPVILVDDATGAASEEVHRANIRDMQNIGVKIVKAADLAGFLVDTVNNSLLKVFLYYLSVGYLGYRSIHSTDRLPIPQSPGAVVYPGHPNGSVWMSGPLCLFIIQFHIF